MGTIVDFELLYLDAQKRIRELEAELAALRQQQGEPALKRFEEHGGHREQDPIERLRFFCSLAMNGQDWLDVEQFFDDLRKQQGEPVAWRFKNNSGDAVTVWLDYVPQEIEAVEMQAREAGGAIEYAYSREAAPEPKE